MSASEKCCAAKPRTERRPAVWEAVERQDDALENLEVQLQNLEERLVPVLRGADESDKPSIASCGQCTMETSIRSRTERVGACVMRVHDLLDRLEI